MRVATDLDAWLSVREILAEKSVGFVPTMGALHEGHLELVRRSASENDRTVVSVFVNAPQFNDPSDLQGYPRSLEGDIRMAADAGADFVFAPTHEAMYADGYRYRVTECDLGRTLEGEHRPGHFDGVLTVVLKLLNLVRPTRAYFGEKDYQQFLMIHGMAAAFFLDTEIVACPTVRETDGLALSSRNALLSPEARERAPRFAELLSVPEVPEVVRRRLEDAGFEVDYVEDVDGRRYGAVHLGGVRLIDNLSLEDDE
jgi:pantoate--beta-alanine ligase